MTKGTVRRRGTGRCIRARVARSEQHRAAMAYVTGATISDAADLVGRAQQKVSNWRKRHEPFDWDIERQAYEARVKAEFNRGVRESAVVLGEEWRRRHETGTDQIETLARAIIRAGGVVMVDKKGEIVVSEATGLPTLPGESRPDRMALAVVRMLDAVSRRRGMMPSEKVLIAFTPETEGEAWRWLKGGVERALVRMLVDPELGLDEQAQHRLATRYREELAREFAP